MVNESQIEYGFVGKLSDLKYTNRPDIRNRKALEENFQQKFQDLNQVKLSDAEFACLRDEIINPDVLSTLTKLKGMNANSYLMFIDSFWFFRNVSLQSHERRRGSRIWRDGTRITKAHHFL